MFRPIRPAVSASSSNAKTGPSIDSSGSPEAPKSIAVACGNCRKRKSKCDGLKPACSRCSRTGMECVYEVQNANMKSLEVKHRTEALEKIFDYLQSKPTDDATDLLSRIRSGADVDSALQDLAEDVNITIPSMNGLTKTSKLDHDTKRNTSSALSSRSPMRVGNGEDKPQETIVVNEEFSRGLVAGAQLDASNCSALQDLPFPVAFPSRKLCALAVDAFFTCSGKLFHVYSPAQATKILESVFANENDKQSKMTICQLCSIGAVGSQYAPEKLSYEHGEYFYNIAKCFLDTVVETRPMEAMKICTLLALYNLLDKKTVALGYIELGLSLARQSNLHTRNRAPDSTVSDWIDHKKAWQTLMFLGSWLSSTLGYFSGHEWLAGKIALKDMEIDGEQQLEDIVQTQMAKIALLKANILRAHLAFKSLSIESIETITEDLRQFYQDMPPEVHLGNAMAPEISRNLRRTIYFIHLLYLGALMLLHRRLLSHFIQTRAQGDEDDLITDTFEAASRHVQEGPVAAKQSLRILMLLKEEDGVFQRCWLCIFQAYTSCSIILHSIAQKQLHSQPRATYENDLAEAKRCLELLAYCGKIDTVAQKFHKTLFIHYEVLTNGASTDIDSFSDDSSSNAYLNARYSHDAAADNTTQVNYLLMFPGSNSQLHRVCRDLMKLVCKPFGGAENAQFAEDNVRMSWIKSTSRLEYPKLIEDLDWNFESSLPLNWGDFEELRTRSVDGKDHEVKPLEGRFLGSESPLGWENSNRKRKQQDRNDGEELPSKSRHRS